MSAGPEPHRAAYPALPPLWRLVLLVAVVTQFLVGHGAVWRHRFDWDSSILWSYATIPPLVLVALLWRRRFGWVAFGLHTLELAFAKFGITAGILLAILIVTRDEPAPPPPAVPPAVAVTLPPPAPRPPVDATQTGSLAGRLVDGHGVPVPGVVAYVTAGVEAWSFTSAATPLLLEYDGTGLSPTLLAGQSGQPFAARSTNGRLHTFLLESVDTSVLRNVPLLASGATGTVDTSDLQGIFTIRCSVHGAAEGRGYVVLTPHPFVGLSGADGSFHFRGVPAGEVMVAVFHPRWRAAPEQRRIEVGREAEVQLVLGE